MYDIKQSAARRRSYGLSVLLALMSTGSALGAQTTLSDIPVYSASTVPANLMLALSVEFPTGVTLAYATAFAPATQYLGYFDNTKCYAYNQSTTVSIDNYFYVSGPPSANGCGGNWSGNFLNWAAMTSLDEFRLTLTGGNRIVDNPGTTILQRSRETGQGGNTNAPVKQYNATSTALAGLVPSQFASSGTVYIRSQNNGAELTSGSDNGIFIEVSNNTNFSASGRGNNDTLYYVRVKVCESGGNNCTQYSGGYKPEGLVQQNANRIRVGAAGYLNRDGNNGPNGVIRSLVRDVGPTKYNGLAARSDNPFKEWDPGTGVFVANPDSTSASSSSVSNSGAVNYLNKFGTAQAYMTYDTISELYWAALAHYMQVPLDSTYTAGAAPGSAPYDGFPVIATTANDPIQYSCQGNSIVVIGDTHTWCDSRVPGGGPNSNGNSGCSNQSPLPAVNGLDAATSATALGKLPLLEANSGNSYSATNALYLPGAYKTSLGTQFATTGAGSSTYGIAGMAYFAHTNDIRTDITEVTAPKQTVDTFVVDVMEPGSADNSSASRATFDPNNLANKNVGPNQYWLAAKYGGFDDVNGDGKPASYLTWHTNTTNGANTRPDNLFPGNRPDLIQSGLATIFNRIASKTALSAVGPGTTTTRSLAPVDTSIYKNSAVGFSVYTTNYQPGDWTGDLQGSISSVAADGTVNPVVASGSPPNQVLVQWSAKSRLDTMAQLLDSSNNPTGWSTTRRIVTMGGTAAHPVGVPFRYNKIASAQQAALNNDSTLVDFLRGDRSKENIKYRSRRSVLGDIVNSEAVLVQGALSPSYAESSNPGYTAFKSTVASRAPVVYVGANDGMLHAFDADFSVPTPLGASNGGGSVAGGGSELFAYVPSFVFAGPSNSPNADGLAALSNIAGITTDPYAHHFYVDQTPVIGDADFNRTDGNAGGTTGSADWHTLLVGALGKGGKGIYALDVTTVPAALSSGTSTTQENSISGKVLWEFTDSDMGFVYGKPLIAKTRKYGWVVLVTSGYNNASGHGDLYVLNAKTGARLETLTTSAGTASGPSGLSRASAYTQDFTDNTIEQVYAGDLLGNVWRFDLSSPSSTPYPEPVLLATLTAPDGTPQPVTTAPRIEADVDLTGLNTRRWVFVGTGQFLDVNDLTTVQTQTMYALRDGTAITPSCVNPNEPDPIAENCVTTSNGLPLDRAGLVTLTDLLNTVTIADNAEGWLYDLPGLTGQASERVVVDPDSQAGVPIIAWATLIPGDDPCFYHGAVYALNYATGKSALLDSSGNTIPSVAPPGGAPTKVSIQQLPNGSLGLLFGSLGGTPTLQNLSTQALSSSLSRTNWREVLDGL